MKKTKDKHLDQELFASFSKLPELPFHQLVRPDESSVKKAKKAFLKDGTPPTFQYGRAQKFDVDAYKESVKKFKDELSKQKEDVLVDLYRAKADELLERANVVEAIKNDEPEKILPLSEQLFGKPAYTQAMLDSELKDRAKNPPPRSRAKNEINAAKMQSLIESVLKAYDFKQCSVHIKDVPSFRIKRSRGHHSRLIIPETFLTSERRAVELLTHEIEVHLLRSENALETPLYLLKQGLDHYLRTEEGLGVYFMRQVEPRGKGRSPGFWNAYTIALAKKFGFTETFNQLVEAKKMVSERRGYEDADAHAKESAWKLCVRTYRGVRDPSVPGHLFARDHIYLSGFLDVQSFLKKNKKELTLLFAGNMGIQHLPIIKKLGIEPSQTPRFIAREILDQNRGKVN